MMSEVFDMYDKYVKPTEPKVELTNESNKLFELDDNKANESQQAAMPNIEELKASLLAELKDQLLKEFAANKDPKEE